MMVVPWHAFAFMLVAVLLAWFHVCSLNHFELLRPWLQTRLSSYLPRQPGYWILYV